MPSDSRRYQGNSNVDIIAGFGSASAYQEIERRLADSARRHSTDLLTGIRGNTCSVIFASIPESGFNHNIEQAGFGVPEGVFILRTGKLAAYNLSILGASLVESAVCEAVSLNDPSSLASQDYISRAFRDYLGEVDKENVFADGLVTQEVERLFWYVSQALGGIKVPNPQAMPTEDDALSLVWQDEGYQIGINVYSNGHMDWFWFNLITDEYEGAEGVPISPLPLKLLKRLNTAFTGG